ncbi:MAG: OsmC family protein [Anaerolineae bacterium]|nr:OsmC family protein [Anaerolineae bacterium]
MNNTHETKVILRNGMHFEGFTDDETQDAFAIQLDAKEAAGGQGKGVSPAKLVLVALAGCMGMDVISILRKKRQNVSDLEVHTHADRADEHPTVYTHIRVTFVFTGQQIDPAAVERAIELSMTKYCPVANLLKLVVPIETDYQIIDAG